MKATELEFTPLEFETRLCPRFRRLHRRLEFTPLEFETLMQFLRQWQTRALEFTPLEFETCMKVAETFNLNPIRIYSVGV